MGQKLLKAGYDKRTVDLMLDAWRASTKRLYSTYLRKWALFVLENRVSLLKPTLPQACRFLRQLADVGVGHGAINAARSALATVLPQYEGFTFGKHPLICLLVKGVYERNPPRPRYSSFWDVRTVFNMFITWGKNRKLTLKRLTFKLVLLLLLVTAQRGQTILALSLEGLLVEDTVTFRLSKLLKHNRLGDPLDSVILRPFLECPRLCVVRTLKEYIKRTEELRKGEKALLISFVKPHRAISRDTLARWVVKTLDWAGLDTSRFKAHSTRGASASAAWQLGIPLNLIMKQAGWKDETSFAHYYNKDIEKDKSDMGPALVAGAMQ